MPPSADERDDDDHEKLLEFEQPINEDDVTGDGNSVDESLAVEEEEDDTTIHQLRSSPPRHTHEDAATVDTMNIGIHNAIDDLRKRVAALETAASAAEASTPPSPTVTATQLQLALSRELRTFRSAAENSDSLPDPVVDAFERAVAAVTYLSAVVLDGDEDHDSSPALTSIYTGLSGLLTQARSSNSTKLRVSATQDQPPALAGIASRLPVRAASRMRLSLETSQLPAELRPVSRLAARQTRQTTHSRAGSSISSFDHDDLYDDLYDNDGTDYGYESHYDRTSTESGPLRAFALSSPLRPQPRTNNRNAYLRGMRTRSFAGSGGINTGLQTMSSPPRLARNGRPSY
ncbi:uncharacterized protein V1518DRAFT_418449 [Limtongia smithiae]|uniref:uncharacterized protein n=1 Tax=Limtongia smithiae TaxID=1125753 RepID=UPI0034CF7C29